MEAKHKTWKNPAPKSESPNLRRSCWGNLYLIKWLILTVILSYLTSGLWVIFTARPTLIDLVFLGDINLLLWLFLTSMSLTIFDKTLDGFFE